MHLAVEALEEKLAPAVYLWTGLASGHMSDLGNWSVAGTAAAALPGASDYLVFNGDAATKSVDNDLGDASFRALQFQDAGYTLGGNAFTLNGDIAASQNAAINAGIHLPAGPHTFLVAPGKNLELHAALAGPGGLVKAAQGTLTMYAGSTYSGPTHLAAGMLLAGAANVLPATTALTVDDGSAFNLWSHDQTIGSLAGGTSNVDLGSATLTVGDATSTVYNGVISGIGGGLIKRGTGALSLTTFNTYNGPTHVMAGTLRVDGSLEPTPTLVVDAGATLTGRGSICSIEVAGTVIPGDATNRGTLFVQNATFLPGSTYKVNATGPRAGLNYGVLSVAGAADFHGATLQVTASYDGPTVTVVRNDGTNPFTTSFAGVADGSSLVVSGRTYQVDYDEANDGRAHDMVLKRAMAQVTLNASAATTSFGQSVTFTANVRTPAGAAGGQVYFVDGATVLGSAPLQAGQASFATANLTIGKHRVVAVYGGDGSLGAATSTPVNLAVTPIATTTRLAYSTNAARTQLTFDAAVGASSGRPEGTVVFSANGKVLQSVAVNNGHAILTVSTTAVVRKSIQAVFVPAGATYLGSSAAPLTITTQLIASAPVRTPGPQNSSLPAGPAGRFTAFRGR